MILQKYLKKEKMEGCTAPSNFTYKKQKNKKIIIK
jgi:hypothetical protein